MCYGVSVRIYGGRQKKNLGDHSLDAAFFIHRERNLSLNLESTNLNKSGLASGFQVSAYFCLPNTCATIFKFNMGSWDVIFICVVKSLPTKPLVV